jgi:hypothetical protein
MSDIQPGDVVVCVDAGPAHHQRAAYYPMLLVRGRCYRVTGVFEFEDGDGLGVELAEDPIKGDDSAWEIERFRKIDKSDEGFSTWMKSLRPIKERVGA